MQLHIKLVLGLPDKEYISCPQWSNVLETELHALQTMEDDSECHEDGV